MSSVGLQSASIGIQNNQNCSDINADGMFGLVSADIYACGFESLHPSVFRSDITSCDGSSSMGPLAAIWSLQSPAYARASGSVFDNQASVDTSPIPSFPEHLQWSCFQEVAESTTCVNDSEQSLKSYIALPGA